MEYLVRTIANFKNSSILGMLTNGFINSSGGLDGEPLSKDATKVSRWVARSKGKANTVSALGCKWVGLLK